MMLYRVLKLVRYTMKKEVRKEVETSGKIWGYVAVEGESENRGKSPRGSKKGGQKFQNLEILKM